MKLRAFEFSPAIRKDTSFIDFVNDITTIVNQGLSAVLIKVSLTGQTAAIASTQIYTPTVAGEFRASVYAICTVAGTGTLAFELTWTDAVGAKAISTISNIDLSSTANGATGSTFIHAVPGAISFSTAIAGLAGSPQYELYIVLEQLA